MLLNTLNIYNKQRINKSLVRCLFCIITLFFLVRVNAQDVTLFKQYGGHVDFTMIGNTLNPEENERNQNCIIFTESSTELNLNSEDTIIGAYLYWAGSGIGDFDVKLNNTNITAERTFADTSEATGLPYFSAYADITEQVQETGNEIYTLSEFDLTDVIPFYCPNGTNFAGWAILIVYENDALPLNQINIYDGLQHVPFDLTIHLDNLNVIDSAGAKIGFIAWEGDASLAVNESLRINGNLIGNPPLNPSNNAFNGTNSFTNQSGLHNMDIDFYNIENNIKPGDTSAIIQLTSGQDFVMINTIVTQLNSQLPDATVNINDFEIINCNANEILVNFSVSNNNSTKTLPENTEIAIYINDQFITTVFTETNIAINSSENFQIPLTIPESELYNFTLTVIADADESILEINENNNSDAITIEYPELPTSIQFENIEACNVGFETGVFDFEEINDLITENIDASIDVLFYPSETHFENDTQSINPLFEYRNTSNSQTIFVKFENEFGCFTSTTFELSVINCPPETVEAFSPNGDNVNDEFDIVGLYDIFTHFKLEIYNRYGNLVFEGNNNSPKWDGRLLNTNKKVPTATYFYILYLNDGDYKPINDWVYLRR